MSVDKKALDLAYISRQWRELQEQNTHLRGELAACRAAADAGQDWHFHDLRRTAITDADGSKVFSGHKSDAMAQRYNVAPIK